MIRLQLTFVHFKESFVAFYTHIKTQTYYFKIDNLFFSLFPNSFFLLLKNFSRWEKSILFPYE